MILSALQRVVARQDLTRGEAHAVLRSILAGEASHIQIGALLVALAMKGETVEELVGFAQAMREEAAKLHPARGTGELKRKASVADTGRGERVERGAGTDPGSRVSSENPALRAAGVPPIVDASGTEREALLVTQPITSSPESKGPHRLVDTCGTGGDAAGTFNISTATAFAVAGAGVRVAKHGNRSISSRCGSADVMEALGVKIELAPDHMARCLDEVGMAFLFAPRLHTAMKHVQPARRDLRLRTIFNLLGPLTNPAGAEAQVVGVYAAGLAEKLALALRELGTRHAFVVHSDDGLDEISTTAPTLVAETVGGEVRTYSLDSRDYGLPRAALSDLAGGDAAQNAAIILAILRGEKGPRRDVVVLNAGAALVASGRCAHLSAGIARAQESLDSGEAHRVLQRLIAFTEACAN
jgi:anthranilate phosphoribosyltransferase